MEVEGATSVIVSIVFGAAPAFLVPGRTSIKMWCWLQLSAFQESEYRAAAVLGARTPRSPKIRLVTDRAVMMKKW